MYLTTTPDKLWAIDIETDPIPATEFYCAVAINILTKETHKFRPEDTEKLKSFVSEKKAEGCKFIGHNIIGFDAPTLNRLIGTKLQITDIIDTMLLGMVFSPSLEGGHSLKAWGVRLKDNKISFDDFSGFTEDMLTYCEQDTILCGKVYLVLRKKMLDIGFVDRGLDIEHRAWLLKEKQKQTGFYFDIKEAELLFAKLRQLEKDIEDELYRDYWPPSLEVVNSYKKARKANGEYSANYLRHKEQYPRIEDLPDGSYNAYDYVYFDVGSPNQRVEKLLELGWKPTSGELTPTGRPKPTKKGKLVPSLERFVEEKNLPQVRLIVDWMNANYLGNMVNTWINAYDDRTGAIHGSLFLANTLRYRHSDPNTANIPAVRVGKDDHPLMGAAGGYTYEARALWKCRPGRRLVGVDAAGIQLRVLAHYLNNETFSKNILSSDPHTANQEAMGLESRALTKTITYACVPMDTLALTKKGWKTYEELEVGELVLSYNAETKTQEWTPILEKVKYDKAPVTEMWHTEGFRVRSTPNHRWFTTNRQFNRWAGRHETNEEKPIVVKTTETLGTMSNIIVNAPLVGDDEVGNFDWMSLPKYETDWVATVLEMSQQERRAFLAGFCIADGYTSPTGRWRWSQLDGPLFEGALLASYLVHDGRLNVSKVKDKPNQKLMKAVLLNAKPHVSTAFFRYEELEEQPVWCIRTANESWVMRQGDVITITGNTLMGAGDGRVAAEARVSMQEAKAAKKKFFDQVPELPALIKRLQAEAERTGRITLCSGNRILVDKPHTVIPFLLQGDESQIMKQALIYTTAEVKKRKLDAMKAADIHDEWQWDVHPDSVDELCEVFDEAFKKAGESFNYNVPIACSYDSGDNWAMTH